MSCRLGVAWVGLSHVPKGMSCGPVQPIFGQSQPSRRRLSQSLHLVAIFVHSTTPKYTTTTIHDRTSRRSSTGPEIPEEMQHTY
ncbi:hypothetical protein K474DRAFT_536945 [Panus rudis PR-1116 ss-1]|nr:hypothetical protein K474DRAFT_536945 [Panus rudis PR-1116 ss-1]